MPNSALRRVPHPPTRARLVRVVLPLALVALAGAGCATTEDVRYGNVVAAPGAYDASSYAVPQPLSVGEIVAALRAGRSSHDLADDIDEQGLLAPATSADIDLLLQSGADGELIDAVREASSMAGRGVAPPTSVSPPVVVTPPYYYPAPLYPDYGWYPYAPYVPYSFGLWYNDSPRYRYRRDDHDFRRPDTRRPDTRRPQRPPGAVAPNWQSPRLPGGGASSQGFIDRQGRQRIPLDSRPNQQQWQIPDQTPGVRQAPQPRGSMGTPNPSSGAVRNRRAIPD
ncbi:MAG: hypothetical protein ROZ64_05755 [Burkholderiaceae bacterium]|nr:hypothetical protein [Burkholderiaceae bacterium]